MNALRRTMQVAALAAVAAWGASIPAAAVVRNVPTVAYPTIQSAVTAANPGDTIQLALGEYRENVTIPAGKTGLFINGSCGNPAGVVVDGSVGGVNGNVFDVSADAANFLCLTVRNGVHGIRNEGNNLIVNRVQFIHNGDKAILTTGNAIKILFSTINGARGGGIHTSGTDGQIRNNTIKYVDEACVVLEFLAERTIVDANTISLCDGEGILSKGAAQTLTNNVIDATDAAAISLSGGDDSLISLNKITNTFHEGIFFSGNRGHIKSNQIEASEGEGIFVEGDDVEVRANIVKTAGVGGGPHACYSIRGNRPTIDGNTASVCGYSGIDTRGQDPTVKNNKVERLNGDGIGIDVMCEFGSSSGSVESNTVTAANGNGGFWIYCPEVYGFVVSKNTATKNAGYGFELYLSDSTIFYNWSYFNGSFRQDGIYIYGDRNTITYNLADDNTEDGLYLCGGSNVLQFNQARRNQDDGLIIDCGVENTVERTTAQYNLGEGIVAATAPQTLRLNNSLNNRRPKNGLGGDCTNDSGGALTLTGNTCVDGSNFVNPSDLEN